MHNNIGGSNLLSSDGYDLLRMKSSDHHHSHEKNTAPKVGGEASTGNVSYYATTAEFFSASVGEDGGYKILAQALNVEFSSTTGSVSYSSASYSYSSSYSSSLEFSESFKPPSPLDVANKVLGLVEKRLNSELEEGAGGERISSLISQAREGVQKGFSQAINDIESLGLMTEKLDKDIGEGLERVESGLTKMEERFNGVPQAEGLEEVLVQPVDQVEGRPVEQPISQSLAQASALAESVGVSGGQAYQDVATHSGGVIESDSMSSRSTYMNSSEFSLKTQDGDTITIRYADAGKEVFESAGNSFLLEQSQFQGYQLEVNGELDEGELAAIADLFSQLGEVSSLFFEGSFQDAFASALEVGFDASEIASFSLDLSQMQTQEVRTYSNPGNVYEQGMGALGAIKKSQPLIEMAGLFENSLELLKMFDEQQFDFRKFVLESISKEAVEQGIVSKVSQNDFSDFAERLLEELAE